MLFLGSVRRERARAPCGRRQLLKNVAPAGRRLVSEPLCRYPEHAHLNATSIPVHCLRQPWRGWAATSLAGR